MTVNDAAAALRVKSARVRYLCKTGRFAGALKLGRDWVIPRESVELYARSDRRPGPKPRPD